MPSLTIAWEYLTGYAVATDTTARERVEWPPHPARVFMALAAAWFETEPNEVDEERARWDAEGAALRWLESLGDPEMILPVIDRESERTAVTFYVPVNGNKSSDTFPEKRSTPLQSSPAISRVKQARQYPRLWVGNEPVRFRWDVAEERDSRVAALDRLCRKVTRIGHSSALVAMRVETEVAPAATGTTLVPSEPGELASLRARSIGDGLVEMLEERYGEGPRRRRDTLSEEILELGTRRKNLKGKGSAAAKAEIDEQLKGLNAMRDEIPKRDPVRPTVGLWRGYRPAGEAPARAISGLFDPDLLILAQVEGRSLPATATLAVTRALRDTIMCLGPQPVPGWVSGHQADGRPAVDGGGHLAIVPLPFVGHEHADGHLLGLALAFPRSIEPRERGRVLGPLLVDAHWQPRELELTLGRLGVWVVRKRGWEEGRTALAPESWTAAPAGTGRPAGARTWATVTPIVLDRFPKADRRDPAQRGEWEAEVAATVGAACTRIGLPEPEQVDVDTTCWHRGGPRAVGKRRPLRGQPGAPADGDAALGDGFPPYPARGTNTSRPQVHAWIRFPEPVVGPVLLGAGRYLGYGFCKPWEPR